MKNEKKSLTQMENQSKGNRERFYEPKGQPRTEIQKTSVEQNQQKTKKSENIGKIASQSIQKALQWVRNRQTEIQ
jgi:hypothetical protein